MGRRTPRRGAGGGARQPKDGEAARIAPPESQAAFHRFSNAAHWQAYFQTYGEEPKDIFREALAQLSGAERRLVADAVADLLGGRFTFAEAHEAWTAAANDTMRIGWDDPAAFRDFLLRVRETIDPVAWPIVRPRFRPPAGGTG